MTQPRPPWRTGRGRLDKTGKIASVASRDDTGAGGPLLRIEQAPLRIQREHYLRERRNGRIAMVVVIAVVALLGWCGYRLGSTLLR